MHDVAFRELGIAADYTALDVTPDELGAAVAEFRGARDFLGANVTVPHKSAVMRWLDEIDPTAAAIGAVNTIVRVGGVGGRLVGCNTDADGFLAALREVVNVRDVRSALLLGAGGSARAVAWTLATNGVAVTVLNRSADRAEALVRDVGAKLADCAVASLDGDGKRGHRLTAAIINDVQAMTVAEHRIGAARNADDVLCVAVGTGVGGGVVIAGRLHTGVDSTAGSIGHLTVEPDGLVCTCGNRGCLEQYASGPAIARLAEATPLSEFFFDTVGEDINLGSLDGKARLAERARPQLEKIPDGAFADLMRQRLTELTGVGARTSSPETHVPVGRARSARPVNAPRRSLVRTAILLLLQRPALALDLPGPYLFTALRQPGVALLVELIAIVHSRPDISTVALIEQFAGRDEGEALQKLAMIDLPGEEATWRAEFIDVIARLDRQTLDQRVDELQAQVAEGGFAALSAEEKDELRQLQSARR